MRFPLIFPELKTAHLSLKQVQIADLAPLLEITRFRFDHPTEKDVQALMWQDYICIVKPTFSYSYKIFDNPRGTFYMVHCV